MTKHGTLQVEFMRLCGLVLYRGEMEIISKSLEKLWCDGTQLLKSEKPTRQQAQQWLGAQPSLNVCIDGLHSLYTMHHDE